LNRREEHLKQNIVDIPFKDDNIPPLRTSDTPKHQKIDLETKFGADKTKQSAVKEAFLYAWNGYITKAWGMDELKPVSGQNQNWMDLGLTIVDSLDTLWIMGLKQEFQEARDWISKNLNFDKPKDVSLFETTIRVLGGLESAFELSKDTMFLKKAEELGERFLPAFNTPTGIPFVSVNLQSGRAGNPGWSGGASVLSEVGTIQLEFKYLSHYTNRSIFQEKALKIFDVLDKAEKHSGLYSVYVHPGTGQFTKRHITLGALGDSFYEYLLKYWIFTGKKEEKYRRMYDDATHNIIQNLVKRSSPSGLLYIAELIGDRITPKMDHLVCFAAAMFALGAQGSSATKHLEIGKDLTSTCNQMYNRTATGISPELVRFEGSEDYVIPGDARHYLLRPETVESYFVLWRLTHDPIYREMGWNVFQAINKYCRTTFGFSGIRDVTTTRVVHDDLQQSFFLAETLKYLYLLFSEDSLIPLDKYVFNTEAHPLGIIK